MFIQIYYLVTEKHLPKTQKHIHKNSSMKSDIIRGFSWFNIKWRQSFCIYPKLTLMVFTIQVLVMSHRPVYLSVCFNLLLAMLRLLWLLRWQQNKVNSNVWCLKCFTWFVYKYSKYDSHVKVLTREFFCDYPNVFVIIFCLWIWHVASLFYIYQLLIGSRILERSSDGWKNILNKKYDPN